mmetsp:Transcript_38048/g.81013  ORF Transcript_38048/g.81013 Transcript_38048/m.81013 type:complete len:264 (+) Transcript_38048:523-1314(+)
MGRRMVSRGSQGAVLRASGDAEACRALLSPLFLLRIHHGTAAEARCPLQALRLLLCRLSLSSGLRCLGQPKACCSRLALLLLLLRFDSCTSRLLRLLFGGRASLLNRQSEPLCTQCQCTILVRQDRRRWLLSCWLLIRLLDRDTETRRSLLLLVVPGSIRRRCAAPICGGLGGRVCRRVGWCVRRGRSGIGSVVRSSGSLWGLCSGGPVLWLHQRSICRRSITSAHCSVCASICRPLIKNCSCLLILNDCNQPSEQLILLARC